MVDKIIAKLKLGLKLTQEEKQMLLSETAKIILFDKLNVQVLNVVINFYRRIKNGHN